MSLISAGSISLDSTFDGQKRMCIFCLGFCELPADEQSSARDVGGRAGEGPWGDGEDPGGAGVRGRPCHRHHQQGRDA